LADGLGGFDAVDGERKEVGSGTQMSVVRHSATAPKSEPDWPGIRIGKQRLAISWLLRPWREPSDCNRRAMLSSQRAACSFATRLLYIFWLFRCPFLLPRLD